MEKITEITTQLDTDVNAYEILIKCKNIAEHLDLTNIIIDNQCYEEKEMLINLIEMIKSLEIEIIDYPFKPEVEA
tara:strand:+ start:245 stop:469 length:225 start_codon:yes stop_codon:yes gene_type:complete